MISARAKSPPRIEAIAKALQPGPIYSNGVLLGNWVEDRAECPKGGTLYFPPKEEIDYEKLKPESRQPDFAMNKLLGLRTAYAGAATHTNDDNNLIIVVAHPGGGNWVEDRIECPKGGTFYFPPKEEIDYEKLIPESRQPDFALNKLNGLRGNVENVYRHDSHDRCGNFATTNDLVYNHLPKPLCGPVQRHYRRCKHQWYPQPDNLECFGNKTEWGLKKFKEYEWACTDVSDYASTLYEETYVPPKPHQYLQRCERKARTSNFTRGFRFSMTKPLAKPKQKKQ